MIRIFSEQLPGHLDRSLAVCYLLVGGDSLLLKESYDFIISETKKQGFGEHVRFSLEKNTDWEVIFGCCRSFNLFSSRLVLTLSLPDSGPDALMMKQLSVLATLLHQDVVLILQNQKFTKAHENSAWFKALPVQTVIVSCFTPDQENLPRWISARAKSMTLDLDEKACQLLCYAYEGNLLALSQALEQLSFLWPDGKLTLQRVEQVANNAANFTVYQWVDSLLAGKSGRALHILHTLQTGGYEPIFLLRSLQRDLLLLLKLQREQGAKSLRMLFDYYHVWQNRRALFSEALRRLSPEEVYRSIQLMTNLEMAIKQDYQGDLWSGLEKLSFLLCEKFFPFSAEFFDAGDF